MDLRILLEPAHGFPSPADIRFLVQHLSKGIDAHLVVDAVRAKAYTEAHEAAGYLACLNDLKELADAMERDETSPDGAAG